MNQEADFIRQFVVPNKRRKYLSLLDTRKGRSKFIEALDHFDELDPQYAWLLPPDAQIVDQIERLLKAKII